MENKFLKNLFGEEDNFFLTFLANLYLKVAITLLK